MTKRTIENNMINVGTELFESDNFAIEYNLFETINQHFDEEPLICETINKEIRCSSIKMTIKIEF